VNSGGSCCAGVNEAASVRGPADVRATALLGNCFLPAVNSGGMMSSGSEVC
jgi:hypothetical protein